MPDIYSIDAAELSEISALRRTTGESQRSKFTAKIVVFRHEESTQVERLAKRAHDVKSAIKTLRYAADALGQGYRFDDDLGAAKIQAVEKAVRTLESEGPWIAETLRPDRPDNR